MAVEIGGVYSVVRDGGAFGVVKILAPQDEAGTIYARIFSVSALERPVAEWFQCQESRLLDESLGVGIGVLPVTSQVFAFWEPVLLFLQEITEAERDDLAYCFGLARPWDDLKYA